MGKEEEREDLDKNQSVENEESATATEDQKTDEHESAGHEDDQQEQAETEESGDSSQDDEAGFLAGFSKVSQLGADETPKPEKTEASSTEPEQSADEPEEEQTEDTDEEGEEEPKAEADSTEEPEQPKEKTELEKAYERIAKLEGRYGNLLQRVTALTASQKQPAQATGKSGNDSAPTQQQVKAALKNDKDLENLIDEFPSFKPMLEELKSIREDYSKAGTPQIDRDKLVEEATQNALYIIEGESLKKDYPTWEDEVKTPEFRKFSIDGGPTEAEFKSLMNIAANNPTGAENVLNSWQGLYPDWWEDKGHLIFSERPSDTRKLMELYTTSKQEPSTTPEPPQPKKDRLRKAVTPRGTSQPLSTAPTDEEAFARGFNRVRGR